MEIRTLLATLWVVFCLGRGRGRRHNLTRAELIIVLSAARAHYLWPAASDCRTQIRVALFFSFAEAEAPEYQTTELWSKSDTLAGGWGRAGVFN